jgi:hypothetical protein
MSVAVDGIVFFRPRYGGPIEPSAVERLAALEDKELAKKLADYDEHTERLRLLHENLDKHYGTVTLDNL